MTPNQVSEFNRDMCNHIYSYKSNPHAKEREAIAKMVVEKYPCVADKQPGHCKWVCKLFYIVALQHSNKKHLLNDQNS